MVAWSCATGQGRWTPTNQDTRPAGPASNGLGLNQQALELDQHGYEVSKDVYANTARAEITTTTSGGKK